MEIKPNEICFLNYINGLDHSNNLPDYWKYNYGINPNRVAKKLVDMGLLEFRLNIEKNVSDLTIPQLKEILKSNNLPLKGKKSDLIAKIFKNVDLTYLEKSFPTKRYCLTDKGKSLVENNYLFIINQKENYNFKDTDILEIYQKYPEKDNKSKLIELFNSVIQKDLIKKEYSDLYLRVWQFYNFYLKLDLFDEALFYFIVSFKLKLFNLNTSEAKIYLDDVSYIDFDSLFIDKLKNIVSLTDASEIKIKNIIETEQITKSLPFKYFSNEECFKILTDLLSDKEFNISNYEVHKPNPNSNEYTYYGLNDEEVPFNNTFKINLTTTKKSNGLINNIINIFTKKGKH